jgi:ankyrin repeat protein
VNVNAQNNEGDSPLHLEAKNLRIASVEVFNLLLNAKANPNLINPSYPYSSMGVSPLSLILQHVVIASNEDVVRAQSLHMDNDAAIPVLGTAGT